ICNEHKIDHRTIKFKHPWTNGMVESFNKKIKNKVFKKNLFQTVFDLEGKVLDYIDNYNHNIRLKSINYKTPNQYLEEHKNLAAPYIKEFIKTQT
ncbi:integrase core domain-containing protein, partial [Patescibacteria group bacterium]|nr:integrase core domain-containing protein [Patescibacteria group bacterium]